jgi:hypothetical protein
MNPTYVQIGIAIATILGSGVVSAAVSHHFTTRRAEREFRRKKTEELFLAFHGYCTLLSSQNVVWPQVMDGTLTYNQALDINADRKDKDFAHFENVEMLVSLYFPTLRPIWTEVLSVRDQINRIRGDFKKQYKIYGPDPSFIRPFCDTVLSLDGKEKAFKDHLAEIYRRL